MNAHTNGRWMKISLLAILLIALSYQITLMVQTYRPRMAEISRSIGQTGKWRGANFAFSRDAADFYGFLNDKIPEDALVLIPSQAKGPESLIRKGYAEFFLWPRNVEYCEGTSADCIRQAGNQDSAVLLTDISGLPSLAELGNRLALFNDRWGAYLPVTPGQGNLQPAYHSLREIGIASLPAIILLLALILPALLLARRTLPNESGLLHLALGIGAGLGWHSVSLFLALWLGFELSNILIISLMAIYWFLIAIAFLFLKTNEKSERPLSFSTRETLLPTLLIALPIAVAFFIAVGNAYSHTDEIVLWGAKGYGVVAVGLQQGVTERGTLTTWYPLNIPLLISSFLTLFGDRLPESKLVFPLYFLGFTGLAYDYFVRKISPWMSLVGALLVATIPSIFLMGTMAHANLPFAFYLTGSILLINFAQNDGTQFSIRYWIWASVFLALAAWTRPEGIYIAWMIAVLVLLFYWRDLQKQKDKVVCLLMVLGSYSLFWVLAAPFAYLQPGFTQSVFSQAVSQILHGNIHFQETGFIVQSMVMGTFSFREWGVMGWLLIPFAAVLFWKTGFGDGDYVIAGFGLATVIAILGAFVANSYLAIEGRDISWWTSTALMRLVFPGLILIWIQFFRKSAALVFPNSPKKA